MKILLAEDDTRLRKNIFHMISKENHYVETVDNGQDAVDYALSTDYDLIILDWMMPKLSGVEACQKLRKHGFQGAILLLTAKDDTDDIIEGLDAGADDYMVKPFKMGELIARIRALLRRKNKPIEQILQFEDLVLDLDSRVLFRKDQEIELTKKEFFLLEYLLINKGRVLTREQIILRIWGFDHDITDNALDALVKLVRKKVDDAGKLSIIQNVRGIGYKMRGSYV